MTGGLGGHGDDMPWGVAPAGHRLPRETRVGRVSLQVADLDRSVEWYTAVLGFQVLARDGAKVVLGASGTPLVELHEKPGVTSVLRRPRLGLYHYAVLLPDRSALGRFVLHVRDLGESAGAADHLVSEALYLWDPDGLGVEVYADRPREMWRHRGREIEMATDPLDLAAVAQAGQGAAWEGMPAGTTIGHVHLHVGDLDQAAAHYHEALGLDKVVWSYPGALFLSAGGYHHHLGVNTWAGAAPAAGEGDARLLEWELLVPEPADVRTALDNVAGAGEGTAAGAVSGPSAEDVVRDPWGTALRLSSMRPPTVPSP